MAYLQPPAPAPRRRGLRIAVVVWAVVTVAVLALAVSRIVDYTSRPEDQHIPLAGGVVTIAEPGEYSVYYETDRGSYAELTGITGPDGRPVAADRPSVNETYTVNERGGVKLASFTATTPGGYRLTGASEDITRGDELVVGTRTVGAILGAVFIGVAGLGILVVGGVALLLVFLHQRRQDARRTGPWSGGQAGWPPPGGPAGWPPPGGPAGWPPPAGPAGWHPPEGPGHPGAPRGADDHGRRG
ncbi:MAG: hypothetical protein ABW212_21600 [Pseudonocardia sediminis]